MADWVAPAARANVPPNQLTDCDQRADINNTNRCRYLQPCSSLANFRARFDGTSTKPQGAPPDFDQRRCDNTNRLPESRIRHSNFRVCRYCVAAIERQRWHVAAKREFSELQPHNSTSNSTNHFLTRLCGICEEREIQLLQQRTGAHANNSIAPAPPPQAMRDKMEDFPYNTCTCKKSVLDARHLCKFHRHQHYLAIIPRLYAQRDANRAWLQSIERVNTRLVCRRSAATKQALNDRRTGVVGGGPIVLRACRCGEDPIDDIREARVLQCMSCEGIVHVTPTNPPQAYGPVPPAQLRNNSHTARYMFRLRRRR